jgi:hypothetical protein
VAGDGVGIGAFDHIDGLRALLQGPDHLLQVPLLVLKVRADDVFAGRT